MIAGFIFKDESILAETEKRLIKKFGKFDFESRILEFTYTDYYEKEFGKNLKRKFISFDDLIAPDKLASIKTLTNRIESKLSAGNNRRINIDPGYIELSKLVIATTKDYSHRIYLTQGIYAEITLSYRNKSFQYRDWTYPDYKSPEYIAIFNHLREIYARQIRN